MMLETAQLTAGGRGEASGHMRRVSHGEEGGEKVKRGGGSVSI